MVVDSDPEPVFDAPREVVDMVVHNGRGKACSIPCRGPTPGELSPSLTPLLLVSGLVLMRLCLCDDGFGIHRAIRSTTAAEGVPPASSPQRASSSAVMRKVRFHSVLVYDDEGLVLVGEDHDSDRELLVHGLLENWS